MVNNKIKPLLNKVALISGGSRGIGRCMAEVYLESGARVFICGRDSKVLQSALDSMSAHGANVAGLAGDVGHPEDVQRIVDATLARFGRIDVLVNNASLLGPRVAIAEYPIDRWLEVIQVNLTGAFLMARAVLPSMLAQQSGSIINVTSGVGRVGRAEWGAYGVSKFGIEGLTQTLAAEVKDFGICVNAVNPNATRTQMRAEAYPEEDPMTLPTPQEIMPLFIHLASDEARGITGQSLEARGWESEN